MLKLQFDKPTDSSYRILCLGAHADDIEIGCGGTILTLLDVYPHVECYWVVFSADQQRASEARHSADSFLKHAQAKHIIIQDFRESFFPYVGAAIKEYFETLKHAFSPDLIFTHFRSDLHQDHRLISELTWNTFRNHLILEYEIPKYEGDLGTPNLFVPLPRVVADKKVELIQKHYPSQAGRSWFRPDTFHGLMSIRGVECNAPEARAEAFQLRKLVV